MKPEEIRQHVGQRVTVQIGHEIVVEEKIGSTSDESQHCVPRLDHQELVPRPEFFGYGAGVEQALQSCIEKVRPRRFAELYFPKA